jgi:ribonuclease HI
VGSGVAVFTGKALKEKLKFRLDNRRINNQAEQLAIVKALEVIEMQQVKNNEPGTTVIYTDSKITLDSKRSAKNHDHLIEEIRKRAVTLNKKNWKIKFKWVKANAGIYAKRNLRSTCEGGNSKPLPNIQQDTKKRYKKGDPGRQYKKMAESMGGNKKKELLLNIFSQV